MKGLKLAVLALFSAAGMYAATATAPQKVSLWEKAKGYATQAKEAYDKYSPQAQELYSQTKDLASKASGYYDQYGKFIPTQTLKEAANTAASTATVWGGK